MPGDNQNFASSRSELFSMIILTGAILGMASLPQFWFSGDYFIGRFDYAGYDFILKSAESSVGIGYYAIMPFVAFAASAAAAAASVLTFTKYEEKGAKAGVALGAAILVSVLLYVTYPTSRMEFYNSAVGISHEFTLMDHLGGGVFLAAAAGIMVIAGSLVILMYIRAAAGKMEE